MVGFASGVSHLALNVCMNPTLRASRKESAETPYHTIEYLHFCLSRPNPAFTPCPISILLNSLSQSHRRSSSHVHTIQVEGRRARLDVFWGFGGEGLRSVGKEREEGKNDGSRIDMLGNTLDF